MPRRFCPNQFMPKSENIEWAKKSIDVDQNEVMRQLELMRDYEFRRAYSDWDRVFRNWCRKAEELKKWKRPRKYRKPEDLTDEQRKRDLEAYEADMRRFKVVK